MEVQLAEAQRRDTEAAAELQRKVSIVLDIVNSIADRNFDVEIPDLGNDAVGQVAAALQQAVSAIKEALIEVRDVATTVSSAAEQLTSASREITSGAQTKHQVLRKPRQAWKRLPQPSNRTLTMLSKLGS